MNDSGNLVVTRNLGDGIHCKGITKRNLPCKKTGNHVLSNHYCTKHQDQAIKEACKTLEGLYKEFDLAQEKDEDLNTLKQKIKQVKHNLAKAKKKCISNVECFKAIHSILDDVEALQSKKVSSRDKSERHILQYDMDQVQSLSKKLNLLSTPSTSTDLQHATETNRKAEAAYESKTKSERQLEELQNELIKTRDKSLDQEKKFQAGLTQLNQQMSGNASQYREAEKIRHELNSRLEQCQSEQAHLSGMLQGKIKDLTIQIAQKTDMYNNLLNKHKQAMEGIQSLGTGSIELQNAIKQLKDTYDKRIASIEMEYKNKASLMGMNDDGTPRPMTGKEIELNEEVLRLTNQLKQSMVALEQLQMVGSEKLEQIQIDSEEARSFPDLSVEIVNLHQQVKRKQKEIMDLQQELQNKRDVESREIQKCAERMRRATDEDRKIISGLNNDIELLSKQLNAKRQEALDLQTRVSTMRQDFTRNIDSLRKKLDMATTRLATAENQMRMKNETIQQQKSLNEQEKMAYKAELQMKYRDAVDRYKQNTDRQLTNKMQQLENYKLQAQSKKQEADVAIVKAREMAKTVQAEKEKLYKAETEQNRRMTEYLRQKDELTAQLSSANARAQQFLSIENDYKRRVATLREEIDTARKRYDSQLNKLKEQITKLQEQRNHALVNLERCAATREGLAVKVNTLQEANDRLQQVYLKIKNDMDVTRAKYEMHIEKLRNQSSQLMNNIRVCQSTLEDASITHDHVKQMKEQVRLLRLDLEKQIRLSKGNEQVLQTVQKQFELTKQENMQLHESLKTCANTRKIAMERLGNTNQNMRELKHMQTELTGELSELSDQYKRQLQTRDAALAREKIQYEVKEDVLRHKIDQLAYNRDELNSQVQGLRKSKDLTTDALVDAELDRSRQIQTLLAAQKAEAMVSYRNKSNVQI